LTGIFAVAAFWSINAVSSYSLDTLGGPNTTRAQVVLSILILLPSATCIGATFPLAIRVFARDERDAARGSAKVYFWNTIGAIAGSLLTGMFLLPHLAYHGATILAIVLNACLAISLVMVMRLPKAHALAGVATLVVLLLSIPTTPENVLRVTALPGPMVEGDFFFNQVGRSATVTVFNQDGDFQFMTNGLPEALASRRGAGVPFTDDGAWLGALPTLVRPGCESMLIVGLGGGTAASFVPPSVNQIDVFELEPAVVKANESIRDLRRLDPLADSRVNIVLNDGRNGLLLTRKRYDAIVSQPSHPWTAGASHLYTREFDQIARDHLLPGGIFLQWMGAEFVDAELLRSMAASLLDVFPHVRLYEPTRRSLMFVASDQPIEPERIEQPKLKVDPRDERFYRAFGMVKPTDLLALLKMDEAALREFAGKSRPITDEFNALAMRAPQLLARAEEEQLEFETSLGAWEPVAYYAARLTEICPTVNYRALGIRIRARTTQASPQILELATDPSERALLESTLAKFAGDTASWGGKLQQAVQIDPNDPRPAFLILAWGELGALPSVDEKTKATLISRLDDRYGNLYKAVVALRNDDLATLRQQEELLASFEPDDIGYEHAMRMRIIWRLGDTGVDRARFGDEALVIAREASPSLGAESVALLETAAAVQANRPYAALATVMTLAKSAIKRVKQFDRGEITIEQVQAFLPVLARCRGLLDDASAFRSVPTQQHRHALRLIDYLLNTSRSER
jgi:hypothetical protein